MKLESGQWSVEDTVSKKTTKVRARFNLVSFRVARDEIASAATKALKSKPKTKLNATAPNGNVYFIEATAD